MRFWTFTIIALFIYLSTIAQAGPIDTFTTTTLKDNTLLEFDTDALSNGMGPHFFAGRTNQFENNLRRSVIAFDLTGFDKTTTITAVSLTLQMDLTISGNTEVSLHRLTSDWGEGASKPSSLSGGGGGAPAEPGDATWEHTFFDKEIWDTPGGDFITTPSATTTVGFPEQYTWGPTPEMLKDVQDWIAQPDSNFGWILIGDEIRRPTAKRFGSRDNEDSAMRPKLIVRFSIPQPDGWLIR